MGLPSIQNYRAEPWFRAALSRALQDTGCRALAYRVAFILLALEQALGRGSLVEVEMIPIESKKLPCRHHNKKEFFIHEVITMVADGYKYPVEPSHWCQDCGSILARAPWSGKPNEFVWIEPAEPRAQ